MCALAIFIANDFVMYRKETLHLHCWTVLNFKLHATLLPEGFVILRCAFLVCDLPFISPGQPNQNTWRQKREAAMCAFGNIVEDDMVHGDAPGSNVVFEPLHRLQPPTAFY